jgi:hypothetical protein
MKNTKKSVSPAKRRRNTKVTFVLKSAAKTGSMVARAGYLPHPEVFREDR